MKAFESALLNIFVSFFIGGLVSMLTITNPLSKIPLFLALTTEMDDAARRRQARKACIYAFIIMTVSLFGGVFILEGFGISYGALRIAGGITISLIGYRMLFQSQDVQRPGEQGRQEIAFFPLALPGISGPGTIAVVIGISTEVAELRNMTQQAIAYSATVFSIFLTVLVVWITLRSARFVTKLMGQESIDALSRLMGFLLVCIGVQFVGSGVRTFIAGA
jgi:multiple antibiotic resistance protein